MWVVLKDILQEALQQGQFGSAAAGGGDGAGASGGRPDRVQVFETGQVLRDEMYDVINMLSTLIRQHTTHDLSSV